MQKQHFSNANLFAILFEPPKAAWGIIMDYQEGYVYYIKDEYFIKANDPNLMQNKENGNYRPTFYCMRDEKTALLWLVSLSSRIEKFQAIYDKQIEKYGNCLTIVIGEYDGKQAAFLLQNMFPTIEKYVDHVHIINGVEAKVIDKVAKDLENNFYKITESVITLPFLFLIFLF